MLCARLCLVTFFAGLASSLLLCLLAAPLNSYDGQTSAHKLAPIFHEAADHNDGDEPFTPVTPIEDDIREWIFPNLEPFQIIRLFDAAAHIEVPEWLRNRTNIAYEYLFVNKSRRPSDGMDMNEYRLVNAQVKMNSALEPYHSADSTAEILREQKAIMVGSYGRPGESLGANINNYAPDNFSDDEIMRLFEMSDNVRRQLVVGEGTLTIAEQRAINDRVFCAYREALAGFGIPTNCQQLSDDDECRICLERLDSEPSFELPCRHRYHIECALSWTKLQRTEHLCLSCATCREGFRIPYLMTKDY